MLLASVVAVQAQTARITASTMDSNGNVYVTGWRSVASVVDIVTIKYDKTGNLKWSHSYPNNPATPDSEGWGIAADPSGNVYVAGHSGTAGNVDCLLIKYSHDYEQGNAPEWVRTYDGGSFKNDQNWSVAVDSDGYIYVTGYSVQSHAGVLAADIVTMKYDSSGNVVWASLYNGPPNLGEHGFAIVVDQATKNVYVTGLSDGAGAGSNEMVTIMYNSLGQEQWAQRYSGPVNLLNRGTSLALDAESNVYVTGWSQGTGSIDCVTIKYSVGGNEMWVSRYDGPAGSNDQAAPPAGWGGGSAYFGNYLQNNQGIIVTTEVLDPASAVEYLMGRVAGLNVNRGVQVSLLAKLNVCLGSLLAKNAGVRENARRVLNAFRNQVRDLAVENVVTEAEEKELTAVANQIDKGILGIETTVVYVAGQSTGVSNNVDFAVVKYNAADGGPMWNLPGQPGTALGSPGNPPNIALRYNGPANGTDRAWAMAMDLDGSIYVTGPSVKGTSTSVDYFTIKYVVNTYKPVALGEGRYNGPGNGVDQSCGLATWRDPASGRQYIFRDPTTKADYVGVTGNSIGDSKLQEYATVMYNGDLDELWVKRYCQ
jgi:uncharacterized delta-60 repeat protein